MAIKYIKKLKLCTVQQFKLSSNQKDLYSMVYLAGLTLLQWHWLLTGSLQLYQGRLELSGAISPLLPYTDCTAAGAYSVWL
jgi:hypothetical protein